MESPILAQCLQTLIKIRILFYHRGKLWFQSLLLKHHTPLLFYLQFDIQEGVSDTKVFFTKIIANAKKAGLKKAIIKFGGGEPILAGYNWIDEIFSIINEISIQQKLAIKFILLTNGLAMPKRLIKIILKHKIYCIVSLDPERTVPKIGAKTYLILIRNLKKMKESGINIIGQFTVYKGNVGTVPDIYNKVSNFNIDLNLSLFQHQNKE